ncbi:MAG TPA: LPXTG cell wall anchor domain-containing protein [Candidatus Saccharimonadales bacterium]|jgi:LPXTG-motif cell wall-anchored protein|nr:LPXTG cell wall anchor domain-containing protein [Candidatus Saccharimonadales bacterium]
MASSNQGGSILSFIVIGSVLAALLIGGAYFVQRRAAPAGTTQEPVAVQPATQSPSEGDKKSTPPADDKKAPAETKKEPTPVKEAPKPAPQATPPAANELPQTGSAGMISSVLGVGLLSGATIAYVRSRRASATF